VIKQRKKRTVSSEQLSESALNECLDFVIFDWGEGFCSGPHFLNLSEDERLQSESVLGFFTGMMFSYFKQGPQEWDSDAMKECGVRLFPEKISEGPIFFSVLSRCYRRFLHTSMNNIFRKMLPPWPGRLKPA